MDTFSSIPSDLSGSLLLAHPALPDENFSRTVVLISSHTEEDGALGAILNRPVGTTLGEFNKAFFMDPLGELPLFYGGPIRTEEVVLAAWQWQKDEGVFRLLYGIDPDQARSLLTEEDFTVRAFLGYSGWGQGQLEEELRHNSWIVQGVQESALEGEREVEVWREILRKLGPEMRLLVEAPEDPSRN